MCMYDLITIGSSMVDFFVRSEEFSLTQTHEGVQLCQRYGDKIEIDDFKMFCGGGGANTAVGFARAGFHVAAVTETGKDLFSQMVLDTLHTEHVATNLVIQEKKEQTGGSVILIGHDGGRTVLVHRGAASLLDPSDIPVEMVEKTQWVHLSSIGGRMAALKTIFKARKGRKMSWNPGKTELMLLAESQFSFATIPVDILFVNEQEWAMLDTVQPAVLAHIPNIVITNGRHGGRIIGNFSEISYKSVSKNSVDDTGAGDAFATGFVTGFIWNKSLEECAQMGAANAASVIGMVGAQTGLLKKSKLQESVR